MVQYGLKAQYLGSKFTGGSILVDGSESIDGSIYTKVILFVKFQKSEISNFLRNRYVLENIRNREACVIF